MYLYSLLVVCISALDFDGLQNFEMLRESPLSSTNHLKSTDIVLWYTSVVRYGPGICFISECILMVLQQDWEKHCIKIHYLMKVLLTL